MHVDFKEVTRLDAGSVGQDVHALGLVNGVAWAVSRALAGDEVIHPEVKHKTSHV